MLRLAVYEQTKLIAPNNVSVVKLYMFFLIIIYFFTTKSLRICYSLYKYIYSTLNYVIRMKKRFFFGLVVAFLGVFIVSCSQSEDLLSTEQAPETRADSPLLIATPTEVYFKNIQFFDIARDTVNIKSAGLSSLIGLTRLDITIQGADKDMFAFTQPELDLIELFDALIGDGIDIPVSYTRDPSVGPHDAELLVTASLLGILLPVQITIPLHGAREESIPNLIRTIPEDGGTVEFEGKVPGVEYLGKGQYHLYFIFDKDIVLVDMAGIDWTDISAPASIVGAKVINGNTLSITIWEDSIYFPNTLRIAPNTVAVATNVNQDRGNEEIILRYSATGRIPDNYIE